MSKTKKTIIIKKKRNEKGWREQSFGSNPHSKVEDLLRTKLYSPTLTKFLHNTTTNHIATTKTKKFNKLAHTYSYQTQLII